MHVNYQKPHDDKEEYLRLADALMDEPMAYYSFQVLYWCGIREGELLALTLDDIDFRKGTIRINKTFQHIKGKDRRHSCTAYR